MIEIGLPAFGVSDESSGFEIAHAAWMIINTCVADFRHEGEDGWCWYAVSPFRIHLPNTRLDISFSPLP